MNKILITVILLLSSIPSVLSQQRVNYKADLALYDKSIAADASRLIGNVVFTDRSTTMYCDSAYYYETSGDIDAFGHIRIIPDAVTSLTGNLLHYKAIDRTANLTGDVVMINDSATLTTQSVFYDMNSGIANYPTKGTVKSGNTTIVSDQGMYDKNIRKAYFKKNVVVTSPESTIHTDTMHYNTISKIVDFFGPTFVIGNDKDSVYCEKGWYNTSNDVASFRQNAWLKGNGSIIKGDTLYYEKHTGLGKAFGHIESIDTTNKVIIRGDYAVYDQIKKTALVTKNALMIQVDNKDSLYLHADTIYSGIFIDTVKIAINEVKDSTALGADSLLTGSTDTVKNVMAVNSKKLERTELTLADNQPNTDASKPKHRLGRKKKNYSSLQDSSKLALADSVQYRIRIDTFKYVNAYHHVKFYREDLQGKSDSLYYSFKDSTLQFIGKPVLWAANSQLSAEHVKIHTRNQKMHKMEMTNMAFVIAKEDTVGYNQIKGRNMTGFFNNNKIYKMLVIGNGQTIYFAVDKGILTGVNKCESSDITLFFKEKGEEKTTKLDRITYKNAISGVFHPPYELSGNDLKLKDFEWLEKQKPKFWSDVFIWQADDQDNQDNNKEKGADE